MSGKGPAAMALTPQDTRTPLGAALNSIPWAGRPFLCRLRHGLFLNMSSMYLRRINDSVLSVNSCITCTPLPVSTIWSIYNVFHLILFGDKWLVSENWTDTTKQRGARAASLQTAPSGAPRSRVGRPSQVGPGAGP